MRRLLWFVLATALLGSMTACSSQAGNHESNGGTSLVDVLQIKDVKSVSGKAQTVVLDSVELRYGEENGWPYLHSIRTNSTDKDIVSTQYGMLAYNKDGQPLKIQWHIMDSSDEEAYACVTESDDVIEAGKTLDESGGWSLYDGEKMTGWPKIGDGGPNKVAYALFCDKQIVFSDGLVWENPQYDDWLATYEGKPVSVQELENYYPFVQTLSE